MIKQFENSLAFVFRAFSWAWSRKICQFPRFSPHCLMLGLKDFYVLSGVCVCIRATFHLILDLAFEAPSISYISIGLQCFKTMPFIIFTLTSFSFQTITFTLLKWRYIFDKLLNIRFSMKYNSRNYQDLYIIYFVVFHIT